MEDNPVNFGNVNYTPQLALRVALQTMKERCMSQQKRLIAVEDENQTLREFIAQDSKGNASNSNSNNSSSNSTNKVITAHNSGGVVENFQLRVQVSELQRQNEQLTAHINMVSAENRKLWSRLSQMAKDKTNDTVLNTNDLSNFDDSDIVRITNSNPNLVRSKTFTQHSPNPNLRHKLITADNTELAKVNDNLEEAFSDVLDSAIQVGFSFLNSSDCMDTQVTKEQNTEEQDLQVEARKCIESLQEMRHEAIKQNQKLNNVFAAVKTKLASKSCGECAKTKKPEMADKSLETDESLNECNNLGGFLSQSKKQQQKQLQQQQQQQEENQQSTFDFVNKLDETMASTSTAVITSTTPPTTAAISTTTTSVPLNVIQEKILADKLDKMCPMCGRIFDSRVTFNIFCEHVEDHFLDDDFDDTNYNKEQDFEILSHAVGNF